jgi:hypothetical protein
MPTIQYRHPYEPTKPGGGGRIASDALRYAHQQSGEFAGLEEGADRYALLLLVKQVGKLAGFTPRMAALLDYYLAFTRDSDWEEGSRPIVYQSLARTALDLGVSERMVQKLEAALFAAGAIGWNDSGNHRRYGQRCPQTGRILYAFGVDLTPLAYLRPKLEALRHEKRLYDEAWLAAKRAISASRARLRGSLGEWEQRAREEGADKPAQLLAFADRYQRLAIQIRTHLSLADLRSLLGQHQAMESDLHAAMGVAAPSSVETPQRSNPGQETRIRSPRGEAGFAHYNYTTHSSKELCSRNDQGFQESVRPGPEPTLPSPPTGQASSGLEHVTLGMALEAASARLKALLPPDPGWSDLVEAAYRLRPVLGVSQQSWGEGCGVLGRSGAAVALLVTDRAALREKAQARAPAAYFRGLVRRAEQGQLRLHSTLFGLLRGDDAT